MKGQKKVLVLGHEMRSTLSVIRSLGKANVHVHLGTDLSEPALCRYSKFVSKTHYFPSVREGITRFIEAFLQHLKSNGYELIIPTTDIFMIPLIRCRNEIEKIARLAVTSNEGFFSAYDKFITAKLASSLDVPIPNSLRVNSFQDVNLSCESTRFPLIIKPRCTQVVVDDTIHHYGVQIARSKREGEQTLMDYLCVTPVLLQDFFAGTGVGTEVICFDGEVLAAFQHKRIHEPLHGGGSSYRKSVRLNPDLLDYTQRLMARLRWTGVAMVEFLSNERTGESVLVEINGRFWGSLPLAIRAGMDFPLYLYQMLVEGKKSFPVEYRENIYCRNLVKDFWYFYSNLGASSKDPYLKTVRISVFFKDVKNILSFRESNDTIQLHDMKPGLIEIEYFLRCFTKLIRKKLRAKLYRLLDRLSLFGWWARREDRVSSIKSVKNVLFICKGNICRSPFAAKYLQRKSKIECHSAGYNPRINRPCPEKALMISNSLNVDLSGHRSSLLSKALLDRSDVVIVMDMENYLEILHSYPQAKKKLLFMSWFRDQKGDLSIPDPIDFPLPLLEEVYKDIARCVDNFLHFIDKKRS
jgi:protein-tyrosine-phosphatase/predicted ATP-grasp superfamily ATP-dependent carboligase